MKTLATLLCALILFASCKRDVLELQKLNGRSTAVLGVSPGGTTYYVDPNGSDTANGTSTTSAWQTLARVDSMIFQPGDKILFLAGGVWAGQLAPKGSGSAAAPIIIDQYGTGNQPRIDGGGVSNNFATVLLSNQSYWEINNLEVTNTAIAGAGLALTGIKVAAMDSSLACTHVYIKNCYVHDVNATGYGTTNYNKASGGILVSGTFNDALVQNCHVKNCAVEGIRTTYTNNLSTNVVFDGNLLENIYGDGMVMSSVAGGAKMTNNTVVNACITNAANFAGIWTYRSHGTLVANNEVYGLTGGMNDGQPFDADINTKGDIFEYNYSHDNSRGFMLFMPDADSIIVRYNVSANDTKGGSKVFNYTSTKTTNQIYNNVFYMTNNATYFFQTKFIGLFANNIVYSSGTITNFSQNAMDATARFVNNCFYPSANVLTTNWGGYQSNNITSNPLFVSPTTYSIGRSTASAFNLQNTSPCYNAGAVMAGNGGVDFAGNALPITSPDMGAFQHAVSGTSTVTIADAYVRDGTYATTNYGTATSLVVKSDATSYNRKAYMKFDLSTLGVSHVSSALLSVYANSVNTSPTRTISVYATTTSSWSESGITWNNAPMDTTLIGTFTVTSTGTYTLDITQNANNILSSSNKIVSLLLMNAGPADSKGDVSFNSREASTNMPSIVVAY
ncbi:MAG: right-handed parallel beta-helix repeat-containing protein [Chitinophaga sp.]|uniref:CBM96 family carbohydrate-binding protein n=1 Tax=Chitinophaga sp. TaxID=1869181 RepID=UPI0025B7C6CC|nr:DNRLRE domain-containing protein [Chitinophaga sp.]MBV8256035.1 right-handed parallel beta-helix repeat-containing protein [Chitinophaga sp.]